MGQGNPSTGDPSSGDPSSGDPSTGDPSTGFLCSPHPAMTFEAPLPGTSPPPWLRMSPMPPVRCDNSSSQRNRGGGRGRGRRIAPLPHGRSEMKSVSSHHEKHRNKHLVTPYRGGCSLHFGPLRRPAHPSCKKSLRCRALWGPLRQGAGSPPRKGCALGRDTCPGLFWALGRTD